MQRRRLQRPPPCRSEQAGKLSTMSETNDIPFGPGPLQGLTVLVVEDDAWAADRIGLILEEEGARLVGPCRSVTEAQALLGAYPVQLVLLDLGLADSFADALASDLVERGIPYVIITGYKAFPSNIHEDAIAVLHKPVDRRQLLDLLSSFA